MAERRAPSVQDKLADIGRRSQSYSENIKNIFQANQHARSISDRRISQIDHAFSFRRAGPQRDRGPYPELALHITAGHHCLNLRGFALYGYEQHPGSSRLGERG